MEHRLLLENVGAAMARRRSGVADHADAHVERLTPSTGYTVATKQDVEEILAIEADLLRSEGLDPRWPGFPEDRQPDDRQQN